MKSVLLIAVILSLTGCMTATYSTVDKVGTRHSISYTSWFLDQNANAVTCTADGLKLSVGSVNSQLDPAMVAAITAGIAAGQAAVKVAP